MARVQGVDAQENMIDDLPRWALVAFATRCADRVLPLFAAQYPEDDRPNDALRGVMAILAQPVDEAVELATDLATLAAHAANASAAAAKIASGAAMIGDATAERANTAAAHAASAAAHATSAAHAASKARIEAIVRSAIAADHLATAAARTIDSADSLVNASVTDAHELCRLRDLHGWGMETPVSLDLLGCLWPEGSEPPDWASA